MLITHNGWLLFYHNHKSRMIVRKLLDHFIYHPYGPKLVNQNQAQGTLP